MKNIQPRVPWYLLSNVFVFSHLFLVSSLTHSSSPFPIFTIHSESLHSRKQAKTVHTVSSTSGTVLKRLHPNMLLSGQSLSRFYLKVCPPQLQSAKHTTVQAGYRKEEPIFPFQIQRCCSKCPYFIFKAALLPSAVFKIREHNYNSPQHKESHLHRSSLAQAQILLHTCIQSLLSHSCKFHFHMGFQQHIHQYLQIVRPRQEYMVILNQNDKKIYVVDVQPEKQKMQELTKSTE